jgi:hypothetical protein
VFGVEAADGSVLSRQSPAILLFIAPCPAQEEFFENGGVFRMWSSERVSWLNGLTPMCHLRNESTYIIWIHCHTQRCGHFYFMPLSFPPRRATPHESRSLAQFVLHVVLIHQRSDFPL